MDRPNEGPLTERVERLEQGVEAILGRLDRIDNAMARRAGTARAEAMGGLGTGEVGRTTTPGTKPSGGAPAGPVDSEGDRGWQDYLGSSESWLGRIGIALVLFSVVFLFRYSIDQGWLIPSIRVGFGVVLGLGLLVLGHLTYGKKRPFSLLMSGGGIAALYISGFAAFQLYSLVSHPVAFGCMCFVTLLGFVLSVRQSEAALSLVAAAGGLGTPFLLYTGSGNIPGLIAYTCLVLAGTSGIYLWRGWRSLLWLTTVGGWSVVVIAGDAPMISPDGKWAVQSGIAFCWLAFWALPTFREVLSAASPGRWTRPSVEWLEPVFSAGVRDFVTRHVHLLAVTTPLFALLLSASIWDLRKIESGWLALAGSAVYGVVGWRLSRPGGTRRLAYTHALVSLLLFTIGLCMLLKGDTLFLAIAAEALVLHLVSLRLADSGTRACAHTLFCILALVLTGRLLHHIDGDPMLNARALTDLVVVGLALGAAWILRPRDAAAVYGIVSHLAVLGWFWRELSQLSNGMGYISIAWGLLALALLVSGLRLNAAWLRAVSLGTLMLVVAKLFLVDLAQLDAIWRILLFMGFGGMFLLLGYHYRGLIGGSAQE